VLELSEGVLSTLANITQPNVGVVLYVHSTSRSGQFKLDMTVNNSKVPSL